MMTQTTTTGLDFTPRKSDYRCDADRRFRIVPFGAKYGWGLCFEDKATGPMYPTLDAAAAAANAVVEAEKETETVERSWTHDAMIFTVNAIHEYALTPDETQLLLMESVTRAEQNEDDEIGHKVVELSLENLLSLRD